MYGLHGVGGTDDGKTGYATAEEAQKQKFITWWASVPPEARAPLVFAFLMANKDASAFKDDPIWIGLTVQKLEDLRKVQPDEFVEIVAAAAKKDEDMQTTAARFLLFGQAWVADKAAEAAKQPAPAAATSGTAVLILGGAALAAAAYYFYGRKRGS